MPIELIIFDLDGVLCDTRPMHFAALNAALETVDPKFVVSPEEHASTFDGLPTSVKLNMLTQQRGLDRSQHDIIWQRKQAYTMTFVEQMPVNHTLIETLHCLKTQYKYKLYVASNSIRSTLEAILKHLQIANFFDATFAATDVKRPKPHPEIYLQCVLHAGLSPRQVMICEDSPIGRRAALESGCHVCPIESPSIITLAFLKQYIAYFDARVLETIQPPWIQPHLTVVIPMAGAGSRFARAGYKPIKPLIDVCGKPMIQHVIDNLNLVAEHIFLCQQQHIKTYHLDMVLPWFCKNRRSQIVAVPELTEGAAVTMLASEAYMRDLDAPLFLANSDQWVDMNMTEFMYRMQAPGIDAGIVVFECPDRDPKWSYVQVDPNTGWVTQVAEKQAISDLATVGFYYWKRGSDFFKYAKQMIAQNIRTNHEFYVCPVFNQAIADKKKIAVYKCRKMWGLGTPEDLAVFLAAHSRTGDHIT